MSALFQWLITLLGIVAAGNAIDLVLNGHQKRVVLRWARHIRNDLGPFKGSLLLRKTRCRLLRSRIVCPKRLNQLLLVNVIGVVGFVVSRYGLTRTEHGREPWQLSLGYVVACAVAIATANSWLDWIVLRRVYPMLATVSCRSHWRTGLNIALLEIHVVITAVCGVVLQGVALSVLNLCPRGLQEFSIWVSMPLGRFSEFNQFSCLPAMIILGTVTRVPAFIFGIFQLCELAFTGMVNAYRWLPRFLVAQLSARGASDAKLKADYKPFTILSGLTALLLAAVKTIALCFT